MPGYKGHLIGGACAFGLLFYCCANANVSHVTFVEWFLLTELGALFPDVDVNSKGQKVFYSMLILSLVILAIFHAWMAFCIIAFLSFFPIVSRHRGLFHKWWFLLLITLGVGIILKSYFPSHQNIVLWDMLFFATGVFSHILLDFKLKVLRW